jgi:DNA modification methylase
MNIVELNITELQEYERNPRKNDKAVAAVAESIKQFGFKVPIVIDKNNVIVAGHTRLKAARRLKLKTVPCIIADDLTPEQVKQFRLADNKVSELAAWNPEMLAEELKEIDFDMGLFGFEDADWLGGGSLEPKEDYFDLDAAAAAVTTPKTKPGDIYQLGRHRLMCGDSTDAEQVKTLMDGQLADLLVTDPPYNVNYEGSGETKRDKIANDNLDSDVFTTFLGDLFTAADQNMKPGASFYIWHADGLPGLNFRLALKIVNWPVRQSIIWNKNVFTLGRQDYQWKHEAALYGWKEGTAHYFTADRTLSTVIKENEGLVIDKMTAAEARKILKDILESGKVAMDIIDVDKPSRSDEHPTMKPVLLFTQLIQNSSRPTERILDICAGSGTTLIAAEQLNRSAYLMELDPKYCDVIVKRYEDFTGGKAELIVVDKQDAQV